MTDVIEPAGTGRAKCRRCQQKIEKGALRFGERIPNPFGEGEATHWFHVMCAAEKRPEKLAAALADFGGELPERERIERIVAEGEKNPTLTGVLRVERAPTGRAACQECHEKITKDELRIVLEREAEQTGMTATAFVHLRCGPAHLGATGLLDKLERCSPELSAEDAAEMRRVLGAA